MENITSTNNRDIILTQRIQNRIFWDWRISNTDVHVLSRSGHVTLVGKVDSLVKKDAATEIVKATKGVVSVTNQLDVPSVFVREDGELKNLIDNKIKVLNFMGKEYISVEVSRGTVKLEGLVLSKQKKAQAAGFVWELSGVRDCLNQIKIDDDVRLFDFAPLETEPAKTTNGPSQELKAQLYSTPVSFAL